MTSDDFIAVCMHGSTLVPLFDGGCLELGELVADKADVSVCGYDQSSKMLVSKRVIGWNNFGPIDCGCAWVTLTVGNFSATLHKSQPVLGVRGWELAANFQIGDWLMTSPGEYRQLSAIGAWSGEVSDQFNLVITDSCPYVVGGKSGGFVVKGD